MCKARQLHTMYGHFFFNEIIFFFRNSLNIIIMILLIINQRRIKIRLKYNVYIIEYAIYNYIILIILSTQ